MAMATWTKLRDGSWGLRVDGPVVAGQPVTARKKSGAITIETVARVLWAGNGVSLCAITTTSAPRKSCVSDGNCSSILPMRWCGGWDCDLA